MKQQIASNILDARDAAKAHDPVNLAPEDVEDVGHTCLTSHGQAPKLRPADQAGVSTQCQRLDHIDTTPDAAIKENWNSLCHRLGHTGKSIKCSGCAIQLPAAMI